MKLLLIILISLSVNPSHTLFDFQSSSNIKSWTIVDDVVMGGRSDGNFGLNEAGHGVFSGKVSLENNGGFSSVRYLFDDIQVSDYRKITLKVKGDGKRYQFRVKTNSRDRHSYITYFETNGKWQTIEIALTELYPSWRGMQLDMPNYPGESMEEIAFLISNKKAESFMLEIDSIELE